MVDREQERVFEREVHVVDRDGGTGAIVAGVVAIVLIAAAAFFFFGDELLSRGGGSGAVIATEAPAALEGAGDTTIEVNQTTVEPEAPASPAQSAPAN